MTPPLTLQYSEDTQECSVTRLMLGLLFFCLVALNAAATEAPQTSVSAHDTQALSVTESRVSQLHTRMKKRIKETMIDRLED